MENQKLTLQDYRNQIKLFQTKLALKVPKQGFSESMLQDVAKVMAVDLKIVFKLSGTNSDRFDWYLIEVSGTFDDLFLAIVNWLELGVEQYLAISSS